MCWGESFNISGQKDQSYLNISIMSVCHGNGLNRANLVNCQLCSKTDSKSVQRSHGLKHVTLGLGIAKQIVWLSYGPTNCSTLQLQKIVQLSHKNSLACSRTKTSLAKGSLKTKNRK